MVVVTFSPYATYLATGSNYKALFGEKGDAQKWNFASYKLFPLSSGITKVFPDSSATRLVLVDEKSDAFIYNPVSVGISVCRPQVGSVYRS